MTKIKKRMTALAAMLLAAALVMGGCGAAGGGQAASDTEAGAVTSEDAEEAAGESADTGDAEAESEDAEAAGDEAASVNEAGLADGTYIVDVSTDSNMFHINEADEGTGVLTVKDGEMSVHIRMPSKNIVNMYYGPKDEAQAEGAELIEPTTDEVTYSDGITDEVYGFDVPVPVIGEEFTVSIIGTHDNWYEHKMMVENPVAQ